jgi:hypothetical protein
MEYLVISTLPCLPMPMPYHATPSSRVARTQLGGRGTATLPASSSFENCGCSSLPCHEIHTIHTHTHTSSLTPNKHRRGSVASIPPFYPLHLIQHHHPACELKRGRSLSSQFIASTPQPSSSRASQQPSPRIHVCLAGPLPKLLRALADPLF